MTSHERLLEVSSRLWDRTQRSCVIRIMTVESAGFSSHGVNTAVDNHHRHDHHYHCRGISEHVAVKLDTQTNTLAQLR